MILALLSAWLAVPVHASSVTPTVTPTPPAVAAQATLVNERVIPQNAQTQMVILYTMMDSSRNSFNNGYAKCLEVMGLDMSRNEKGEPCWQWDMGRGVFVQTCLTPTATPSKKK